jgi:hypothetical protein
LTRGRNAGGVVRKSIAGRRARSARKYC